MDRTIIASPKEGVEKAIEKGCQTTIELRHRFDEAPLKECPSCGGAIRRLYQPVEIKFKGSGWYRTDSRPATEKKGDDIEGKKVAMAA